MRTRHKSFSPRKVRLRITKVQAEAGARSGAETGCKVKVGTQTVIGTGLPSSRCFPVSYPYTQSISLILPPCEPTHQFYSHSFHLFFSRSKGAGKGHTVPGTVFPANTLHSGRQTRILMAQQQSPPHSLRDFILTFQNTGSKEKILKASRTKNLIT